MPMENGQQILKTRDDPKPVTIHRRSETPENLNQFQIESNAPSWAKVGVPFGPETIRTRIEPWLTALVQSEHLSLFVGSGLTHAVHHMATGESALGMGTVPFPVFNDEIATYAKRSSMTAGRKEGNIEDQLRTANELLRGLEILAANKSSKPDDHARIRDLQNALTEILNNFADAILKAEQNLTLGPADKCENSFNYLISFLMSFASRSGTRERLQLFTTNYDRYIEAGADLAGLRLIDRFVGSLTPVFRSSRQDVDLHYNPREWPWRTRV